MQDTFRSPTSMLHFAALFPREKPLLKIIVNSIGLK